MKPLKNDTYQKIRFRIITNDLGPGQLLNEKDLMKEYQIGRTPLREIFFELERDGFIQRFPRSGTFVTPIDLPLFKKTMEIRLPLEELAGSLAAERITGKDLEILKQIMNKMKEFEKANEDYDKFKMVTQCEFDFHNTLYEATCNNKLRDILYELHGVSARFWFNWVYSKNEVISQFADANELIDALEKRDCKKSGELLKDHVQRFVNRIKDEIAK
jgi:GntR family transcriptional regulator, rspAB operon transcriptional repressor